RIQEQHRQIAVQRQQDHIERLERKLNRTALRTQTASPASMSSKTPSSIATTQSSQQSIAPQQPQHVHLVPVYTQQQPVANPFQQPATSSNQILLQNRIHRPNNSYHRRPSGTMVPPLDRGRFPCPLSSLAEPQLPACGHLREERWLFWLRVHPDCIFVSTLRLIITQGVRVGYQGPEQTILSKPLPSASEAPQVLDEDIPNSSVITDGP
ncbi:MAG: hypothetical protein Q9196_002891, partial [Gyalolechia fulgens]